MKNERNVSVTENGQEPKRRYRLNKRKFAVTLAVFCFTAAVIIIAARYIIKAGGEAVAALEPPQSTQSGPAVSGIDPEKSIVGKIIIIDAGHGGDDQGATGVNGSIERELNLSIALLLKQQLESKGARVVLTRSDENALANKNEQEWKDKDFDRRGNIIQESGADAVISVHMNSFGDSSVSGPLVLFLPGSEQGKSLAESIQRSMNENLDPETPGRSRSDNLRILKYGFQPSALVECGYISNPQEEEKLNTEEYQLEVAKAICDGIIEYFAG